MTQETYKELLAWQKSMDLVTDIYEATRDFPKSEVYGLAMQLRRASVSIPSNIAEGQGRRSINEFLHFLSIGYGSLRETETQLLISERLGFVKKPQLNALLEQAAQVGRLINGLRKSLQIQ